MAASAVAASGVVKNRAQAKKSKNPSKKRNSEGTGRDDSGNHEKKRLLWGWQLVLFESDPGMAPASLEEKLLSLCMTQNQGKADSRRKVACFVGSLDEAKNAVNVFRALEIFVVCLHDGMPRQQRKDLLGRFEAQSQGAILLISPADCGKQTNINADLDMCLRSIVRLANLHQKKAEAKPVVALSTRVDLKNLVGSALKNSTRLVDCVAFDHTGDACWSSIAFPSGVQRQANALVELAHSYLSAVKSGAKSSNNGSLKSLRECIKVGVCRGLVGLLSQVPSKLLKRYMKILGMDGDESCHLVGNVRLAARTRWLDGAKGSAMGAPWELERHGASVDSYSLQVRGEVEAGEWPEWNPNPDCADIDRWGGRYGKPAGHNEVAMFKCRPWAPLEVVNSRICSRVNPAPGNDAGYDGCYEYLSANCERHRRCMTVWDPHAFHYITPERGFVFLKRDFLIHTPLRILPSMFETLKRFTIACSGQHHPYQLICTLYTCVGWISKGAIFTPLSASLTSTVLKFVVPPDVISFFTIDNSK